jgi:glycosyltransferase involved in cell wall biosynthesis
MEEPLVSIIIPCYNYERWVGEAIQSCLDQTYKNTEIIVVDDGSTDGSYRVIEDMQRRYPSSVRCRTKEHGGHSSARNAGLEMSRGEYLLYLDADDLLIPDSIEAFVRKIREKRVDAVVADWINFFEDSDKIEFRSSCFLFPEDPLASLIKMPMVESAIVIRRTARRWNEKMTVNEIFEYFFSLFADGYTVAHMDKIVARKRQHTMKHRITVQHDHFDPVVWLDVYCAYKETLRSKNALTVHREMVLDLQIVSNIYSARRKGMRVYDAYSRYLNIREFPRYYWYKPFGISGFIYRLGTGPGIESFYIINRIMRRI